MSRTAKSNSIIIQKIILFMVGIAVVSGCVFRRMALSNAQTLLRLRIDETFNLSDEQETFVSKHLNEWLNEVNQKDVPKLQSLLADAVTRTERHVTKQDVSELFHQWDGIYAGAITRSAPAVGEFLAGLAKHQLVHFEEQLKKKQNKRLESFIQGKSSFIEQRTKTVQKRFSDWMGELSEAQVSAIGVFSGGDFDLIQQETSARTRSQTNLLRLLHQKNDPQTLSKYYLQQQVTPYSALDSEHLRIKNKRREAWIALITQVANLATNEQKKTFRSEAHSLAKDLLLIGEPSNAK